MASPQTSGYPIIKFCFRTHPICCFVPASFCGPPLYPLSNSLVQTLEKSGRNKLCLDLSEALTLP